MKVSIITVSYNSERFIEDCIKSVITQDYRNIEYIVIDGNSTDNTTSIISKYISKISTFISEPDTGIYDAMNKGISYATGEIVGILNSDDMFHSVSSVSNIVNVFKTHSLDCVYANLTYFKKEPQSVSRYYRSNNFNNSLFLIGDSPPHPTFYVKLKAYRKYGHYSTKYPVAADFELMMRFMLIHGLKSLHLDETIVNMRLGGESTRSILSYFYNNKEKLMILKSYGYKTTYLNLYSRYFYKFLQLIER